MFVAPLRIARGVQTKVLEAAACELPIVCSPEVFLGLEDGGFRHGEHLVVADNEADFVAAVDQLIESPESRSRLGKRARKLVSANYSWGENMERLEAVLTGQPGSSPPVREVRGVV